MKTFNLTNKKKYIAPELQSVKLDNEISLSLESVPPSGPDESYLKTSENLTNNALNA